MTLHIRRSLKCSRRRHRASLSCFWEVDTCVSVGQVPQAPLECVQTTILWKRPPVLGLKHHFEGLFVCELLTIEHFVNAEVAFKPRKCGFEDRRLKSHQYVPNATSWERLVNSVLDQCARLPSLVHSYSIVWPTCHAETVWEPKR